MPWRTAGSIAPLCLANGPGAVPSMPSTMPIVIANRMVISLSVSSPLDPAFGQTVVGGDVDRVAVEIQGARLLGRDDAHFQWPPSVELDRFGRERAESVHEVRLRVRLVLEDDRPVRGKGAGVRRDGAQRSLRDSSRLDKSRVAGPV